MSSLPLSTALTSAPSLRGSRRLTLFSTRSPRLSSLVNSPPRHLAEAISAREAPKLAMADTMEEEYATQAKLLKEFGNTSDIEKAWTFNSKGSNSQAMFLLSQANLLENMKRKSILTAHISKGLDCSVNFDWSPFPIELQGVSALVPSPSGSKLLVVRKDSPTHFELWSHSMLQKEIHVPKKIHGAVFADECPDGTSLVFLSAKSAVDSGVHSATDSLHRINWTRGGKPSSSSQIFDVVPVVMCAGDGCFPGLYSSTVLMHPWLSDGCTMILCSYWGSIQVILSINTLSGKVTRLTPSDSRSSWSALALDGDNILAVSSSPVEPPQVRYGFSFSSKGQEIPELRWEWSDIASPFFEYSKKVKSLLASLKFDVLKIPIINGPGNLTEGAKKPIEAIFVTSDILHEKPYKEEGSDNCLNPLIVVIHGGPHSVSLTSYSKSLAFLAALGYNLLIVNYRGSRGFGEEALQSLPGKIGSQDVGDVLSALDYVTDMGLVDPSRVAVVGGSHGGFLTTHLIGQAPDKFKVAAVRNPVCNISLMVGTSDIPDWCYVEAYGLEGKHFCTEAPSVEHLQHFLSKSPIAHLSKVKVPVLFLLGARDLRVPVSNGLQYARSLKEKGGDVKVIVFPDDVHGIERPQSDFESFLNIGVWFKKYCR